MMTLSIEEAAKARGTDVFIKTSEAAALLRVTPARVRQLIRAGALLAILVKDAPLPYYIISRNDVMNRANEKPKSGPKPKPKISS